MNTCYVKNLAFAAWIPGNMGSLVVAYQYNLLITFDL